MSATEPDHDAPFSTGYADDGRMRARTSRSPGTVVAHGYLTPEPAWGDVERGNPLPYTLPLAERRRVGLTRATWRLSIDADPDSDTRLEAPLSIDFPALLRLGEQHAVRFVKAVTCNNIGDPLGVGLWEGVPLRDLIWRTRPVENLRRVYYYGYHNADPRQLFQSSLPIGRVLEDPPGELPILVCYKLNGEFLTGRRGGPVRMVVPEAYGFKSVKWLQRVLLTNDWRANDTYALGNNDLESPMKSFARFADVPRTASAGEPVVVHGLAQVGVSGVRAVQWTAAPGDDDWHDADLVPPPAAAWGGGMPPGPLPPTPLQFDSAGRPRAWPLRYTVVHWTATLPPRPPVRYTLRCRTIDLNGIAQPMPRPFPKSGRAEIEAVPLTVVAD